MIVNDFYIDEFELKIKENKEIMKKYKNDIDSSKIETLNFLKRYIEMVMRLRTEKEKFLELKKQREEIDKLLQKKII